MAQLHEIDITPGAGVAPVPPAVVPETEHPPVAVEPRGEPVLRETVAPSASPLDLPNDVFEAGLARRRQNRAAIMGWIRESLVEGTDYGRIHVASRDKCAYARRGEMAQCPTPGHWTKPSLFKPGAEKICGMLGVTVHYPNLTAYEQAALSGRPLGTIILRCELRDSQGHVVAEGIGARNVQQDYGDLNKSLKMAGKSAHIDATLRMAGLSEVFTQDLEDMSMGNLSRGEAAGSDRGRSESPAREAYGSGGSATPITAAQVSYLEGRIKTLGLDRERVLRWVRNASKDKIHTFEELSPEVYDRVVAKLDEWTKADKPDKPDKADAAEGG
jgi:hypothetical protein